MNNKVFGCLAALASLPALAFAQNASPAQAIPADDPVQTEIALVTQAHAAARSSDDSTVDARLEASPTTPHAPASSILLARRAMMLCSWLQNENEYGRAELIAQRVVTKLATLEESNDTDREERLYWEACLEARILDHKARAIALLRAAEKLQPDDDRLVDLELPLVAAVNSFGH